MSERVSRVPASRCPCCDYLLDVATAVNDEDATPSEGDLSICINCGELLTYTASLENAKLSDEMFVELPYEIRKSLRLGQEHIMEMIKHRAAKGVH